MPWVFRCDSEGPPLAAARVCCVRDRGHEGRHRWWADDGEAMVEWTDGWTQQGLIHGAWRDEDTEKEEA